MISPYLLIFALLLSFFLLSRAVPNANRGCYKISIIVLTLFLALRYGQGSDYSMYEWFYIVAPDHLDFSHLFFSDAYHTEIGWKVIMCCLKMAGISFEAFIIVLSVIMMACLHRCISLLSRDWMLSLLISFPTLYLIGFFSMLRQGLVVALWLGFLLNLLIQRKALRLYSLVSVLLTLIHTMAVIFIAALVVVRLMDAARDRSWLMLFLAICGLLGVVPLAVDSIRITMATLPFVGVYYRTAEISWLSLLERSMWFLIIVPSGYQFATTREKQSQHELLTLLDLYVFGTSLYLLFLPSPITASRFSFAFESLELLLVPLVFSRVRNWKNAVTLLICVLSIVFVIKNINACIDERHYYSFVNWTNYPYVSIFDDPNELSSYRQPSQYSGMP